MGVAVIACLAVLGGHRVLPAPVASDAPPAAPGVAIAYSLAADGFVSLAVYDAAGALRRTLLSGVPQRAGAHAETWDGIDRYGVALPPGEYSWKLLTHPGLAARFVTQVGANNLPSWQAPVGNWHAADAVFADASGVYLGSGETENGMRSQKTDWNGQVIWQGGTGGQDGANDPFVWSMSVTSERLYMLSAQRDVWFRGADGSFVPRPALNARFDGDSKDGKFQDQTDMAAANVTVGETKGIEVIAVAYADHGAIRYYRRGTPGVEGDFVLLETLPVKAPRSLDLRRDGALVVLSEDGVLLVTRGEQKPRVLIEAAKLEAPNRVRVDRDSGDIFVACAGQTQQAKRFSADGTFLQAFGRKGGRNPEGAFDPTGLRAIGDLAPDGKGGVIVVERGAAPRRAVHFHKDGTVARQWFGGAPFNTIGCPEPHDPTHVWYSQGYEVARAEVDYDKGTWKPVEIYPGFRTLAHVLRAATRGKYVYLLDAYGWGEIKIYDAERKTLRRAAEVGEIKNLPAELQPPAEGDARLYLWSDLNDDGQQSRDEFQAMHGWSGAMPQLLPDLTFMPATGALLVPARMTNGGTPVYTPKQAVAFPAEITLEGGKYIDPLHLARGPGSTGWYRAFQNARREPGHWDTFGIYFWNGKSGLNRLMRYDENRHLLWEVGRHSTAWDHRPGTQSFPNAPVSAGDYVFVAEASDTERPWYAVFDKDGLFVDDLPHRQADGLPEFAYQALICGDNYGLNVWGNPESGSVLLFASGMWSAPIYRVTGWNDIVRQSGKITLPAGLPSATAQGTGLSVEVFDNPNLEGEPMVKRTGQAYISYDKSDPIFGPELKARTVSVRFTGQIEAPLSEDWRLFASGSDDIKIWLGGSEWTVDSPLRLGAGQRLEIVAEIRKLPNERGDGRRRVMVGWESRSTEQQAVPARFLYPRGAGRTVPDVQALRTPRPSLAAGPNGLIGSWPLRESSGVTARNEADFSKPAQLHGATASKDGVEFSPGSYASIQSSLPQDAQTVAFRFRTTGNNATLYDAGRHFTFYNSFIDRSLKLTPEGLTGEAGGQSVRAIGKFSDGEWHHVLHTFDRAGQRLFLDGQPATTGKAPQFTKSAPVTVRLAPENAGGAGVWVRDLRIYERSLSHAEITALVEP